MDTLEYYEWYQKHEDDLWAEFHESGAYDEGQDYETWLETKYEEYVKNTTI
jgi:hypothetical protein